MVDDPIYVSGWTISGLAVLMAIVTGLILGILPPGISILYNRVQSSAAI
jgi:hypothetical protein